MVVVVAVGFSFFFFFFLLLLSAGAPPPPSLPLLLPACDSHRHKKPLAVDTRRYLGTSANTTKITIRMKFDHSHTHTHTHAHTQAHTQAHKRKLSHEPAVVRQMYAHNFAPNAVERQLLDH